MTYSNNGSTNVQPYQYFRSMIESQMNEGQSGVMKVTDVNSTIMLELMRFIYAGKVNQLYENASELLIVADKYGIVELKRVCVEALEQQLTENNVVELLKFTYVLDILKLRENCIDFIKL
ncbi:speckle-type POZ protein B-like [Chironomus tepperi]|uniref:speckle-type POZ protein B-like n=1 Tax=Chironomus tepperi TaxID=113505 RepID=UPI00391F1EE9